MINKTSLNKVVVEKVLNACKASLSNVSGQFYVYNKKGNPFLRVKKIIKKDGKIGFEILDTNNRNVAELFTVQLVIKGKSKEFCGNKRAFNLNQFFLDRIAYDHEIGLIAQ